MESAQKTLDLIPLFTETVKKVLTAMDNFGTTFDARSLESHVEAQCRALSAVVYETCWIIRMKNHPIPKSLACACGHLQHNKGVRPRQLRTVFGDITLEVRHYFYCDHCQASTYLGDELRGESDFSQLAEDRIAFVGKDGAFKPAAQSLKHLDLMTIRETDLWNGKVDAVIEAIKNVSTELGAPSKSFGRGQGGGLTMDCISGHWIF